MFMTELDDPDEIVKVCQGRPIDDATEIRIVDENGVDVPEGQYGEVICRGPYTIDGYYKSSEANKTSFNSDGFYLTGDKAMRDKENRYRFGGRVKEQINRAGEKIMPSEVEEALCEHKKISDAAVVGIKDDILGEKICACVIYKDNSDTSVVSLISTSIFSFFRSSIIFLAKICSVPKWPASAMAIPMAFDSIA